MSCHEEDRPTSASSQHSTIPSFRSSVLFLCTGNYYRSRFAEICFNWHARQRELSWRADSRALALEFGSGNVGPLSFSAIDALTRRGIPIPGSPRFPIQAVEDDFANAHLIVALCEREHRPLIRARFPAWEERVEYWQVEDLGITPAIDGMAQVEKQVLLLRDRLDTLKSAR